MIPSIPEGHKLHFGDAEYFKFEEGGLGALQDVGFVLVAGGPLFPFVPNLSIHFNVHTHTTARTPFHPTPTRSKVLLFDT